MLRTAAVVAANPPSRSAWDRMIGWPVGPLCPMAAVMARSRCRTRTPTPAGSGICRGPQRPDPIRRLIRHHHTQGLPRPDFRRQGQETHPALPDRLGVCPASRLRGRRGAPGYQTEQYPADTAYTHATRWPECSPPAASTRAPAFRAVTHPRAWTTPLNPSVYPVVLRGLRNGRSPGPRHGETVLGLPADFLIDPAGRVVALRYGRHTNDQWSVVQRTGRRAGPAPRAAARERGAWRYGVNRHQPASADHAIRPPHSTSRQDRRGARVRQSA
jgi:hypothetical protein